MSDFLLEFFCEEIPARMQARAEADLERLLCARLTEAGLGWSSLETFSGPRRIGLVITGLPDKTEDVREERKGPRTDAPEKALQGFLRGAGLSSVDQCKVEEGKKGAFYVAVIEKPGRATRDVLAEAIPEVVKSFPWPKSMKFGEGDRTQRWVRPLQRIVALLDGEVVETGVFGLKAFNITEGHRIHGSGPFEVTGWDDYQAKLKANGVLLMRSERRAKILLDARKVCADSGLVLVEDDGLLEEVTGLVEHPCAILGDMDPGFLDLPPEVIQLTMKTHQKYFAVADGDGKIAPKFVVIANQDAPDGGAAIAAGNSRVLSARLSDARHFWDLDRAKGLEAMAEELSKVTFHEKLGTVADKAERVAALAYELADSVGANRDLAFIAAKLAKADLVSQMVYEFPELQGVMGRYYALEAAAPSVRFADTSPASGGGHLPGDAGMSPPASGGLQSPRSIRGIDRMTGDPKGRGGLTGLSDEDRQSVADAIRDHYKPQGPSDAVPTAPVSAAVALADKLDTLVGFWAIDEKPTGSKDPFALRRAALGEINILADGVVRLAMRHHIDLHFDELRFERLLKTSKLIEYQTDPDGPRIKVGFDHDSLATDQHIDIVAEATSALREICLGPDSDSTFPTGKRDAAGSIWFDIRIGQTSPAGAGRAGKVKETFFKFLSQPIAFELGRPTNLLAFFADRLKVHLKDEGVRHDVIDAVFALGDDDLVRVTKKSRALQAFLETEDGAALLAGYRRAANILGAEEKKGFDLASALAEALPPSVPGEARATSPASGGGKGASGSGDFPPPRAGEVGAAERRSEGGALSDDQTAALLIAIARTAEAPEERTLISEIQGAEEVATKALADEDFESAMAALSKLRGPVDAFFEAVVVNAQDPIVRRNRLLLLSRIRAAVDAVADFSKLEG